MAVELSGTAQYYTLASGLGLGSNSAFWVAGRAKHDTTAAQMLVTVGVAGSGNNRRMLLYGTTGYLVQTINNTGVAASTTAIAANYAQWHTVIGECASGTSRACQVDAGTRQTNATSNSLTLAPTEIRIGASHTGTGPLDGQLSWIGIWSGTPTADNRTALWDRAHPRLVSPSTLLDVWDMTGGASIPGWRGNVLVATGSPITRIAQSLYVPRGRSMVVKGSGVLLNNYVLSAASQSLLLDGLTSELLAGWALSAASELLALAGSDATLTLNTAKSLIADSGALALAGAAATLSFERTVVASPGALALNGSDAALSLGTAQSLVAESGSLALNGAASALVIGYRLDALAGALALQGQDATFGLGLPQTLQADPGSLALSGAVSTFVVARTLAAGVGLLELQAFQADLARRLTTRPSGSYTADVFWVPVPSGTLHGVTSDLSDTTYARGFGGSADLGRAMILSFPPMANPAAGDITFVIRWRQTYGP